MGKMVWHRDDEVIDFPYKKEFDLILRRLDGDDSRMFVEACESFDRYGKCFMKKVIKQGSLDNQVKFVKSYISED